MNYHHNLLLYHTITPLHVGCGQDVGVVDLPVIRERATGYPFIPGSGLRGALREHVETSGKAGEATAALLFGPEPKAGEEVAHAGCVAIHDARLLLFPVRSDHEVFLWLTCPAVLRRLRRDVALFTPKSTKLAPAIAIKLDGEELLGPQGLGANGRPVHLEEFAYNPVKATADEAGKLAAWAAELGRVAGLDGLKERTVLVSDASFYHFVTFATVLQQHNRLTSAKTVAGGMLFSIEAVPPETVFYGFAGGTRSRQSPPEGKERLTPQQVIAKLCAAVTRKRAGRQEECFHFGGDESTGLGVTRLVWVS